MVKKSLPKIFLVLGLAMLGLGFFYSYNLKQLQEAAKKAEPGTPLVESDTYTLENNQYEGEYTPNTEFSLLNETDSSFLLTEIEEDLTVNTYNTAGFAEEFELMEQERSSSKLPAFMIFGGAFFLAFGFILFRNKLNS